MSTIEDRVKHIVAEQFCVEKDSFEVGDLLADKFQADSLDGVEICMTLEDEFEIEIPDEDITQLTSVEAITSYITPRVPQ